MDDRQILFQQQHLWELWCPKTIIFSKIIKLMKLNLLTFSAPDLLSTAGLSYSVILILKHVDGPLVSYCSINTIGVIPCSHSIILKLVFNIDGPQVAPIPESKITKLMKAWIWIKRFENYSPKPVVKVGYDCVLLLCQFTSTWSVRLSRRSDCAELTTSSWESKKLESSFDPAIVLAGWRALHSFCLSHFRLSHQIE